MVERIAAIVQNSIMMLVYKKHIIFTSFMLFLLLGINSAPSQAQSFNLTPDIQQKSFLTSDRIKLQYLVGGQGTKTLFFIPGWMMPAEVFNAQLNYFAKDYRVISFSPRSQGKSDIYLGANLAEVRARDIKELLASTQTTEFTLIGWSLGVMEALDYVNRYGDRGLQSLVLIDNSIGEGTPPKASVSSKRAKMTTASFKKYVKGFVSAIFKSNPPSEFIQTIENSALRLASSPEDAFAILRKPYSREYYRDTIYKTQVPIWYAITPRYSEQALLFSEKHPLGEFKIYEDNTGHGLFVDKATEFNLDLENFLRKSN
jgi:microsomal epoxide hydrolase